MRMSLDQVKIAVERYFGDTSRPVEETAAGLLEIVELINGMLDAMEDKS